VPPLRKSDEIPASLIEKRMTKKLFPTSQLRTNDITLTCAVLLCTYWFSPFIGELCSDQGIQNDNRKGVKVSEGFLMPMAPENAQGKEFLVPEPYELDELYEMIRKDCNDKEADCTKSKIIEITKRHGARAAIDLYKELIKEDGVWGYWTHHIAHHIGYYNVITFGAFPEILALCAEDFQSGCVHGFYQGAALSKQLSPQEAKKFSDDLAGDASLSSNFRLSLYHGLGHAYMVHGDYDMQKALDLCDQLDDNSNIRSCWNGMFMENEDCSLMGDWEKCGYSIEDPTAPCSQLPSIYQDSCYFNHSRWLLTLFNNNFKKVINVCKNIPEGRGIHCLQYLIHIMTEPAWQRNEIENYSSRSSVETAVYACQQFPDDQKRFCIANTIVNFKRRKEWGKSQIEKFCQGFKAKYNKMCFSIANKNK